MTAIQKPIDYLGELPADSSAMPALAVPQRRPPLQPFWFLPSLTLAVISWISGGIPELSDFAMLGVLGVSLRSIFWLSLVPGLVAVAVAAFVVDERRVPTPKPGAAPAPAPTAPSSAAARCR